MRKQTQINPIFLPFQKNFDDLLKPFLVQHNFSRLKDFSGQKGREYYVTYRHPKFTIRIGYEPGSSPFALIDRINPITNRAEIIFLYKLARAWGVAESKWPENVFLAYKDVPNQALREYFKALCYLLQHHLKELL